jgi:hypothetical protein
MVYPTQKRNGRKVHGLVPIRDLFDMGSVTPIRIAEEKIRAALYPKAMITRQKEYACEQLIRVRLSVLL